MLGYLSWDFLQIREFHSQYVARFIHYISSSIHLFPQVKSGGHISIPKIYPPLGFLIPLTKFNQIAYDNDKKTLDVGAGVTWSKVYSYLATLTSDRELGAVGGDPRVGVSGWLLGGGYSLLTNKYGLGMDNVVEFQVLLPGARAVCNVSRIENPDLFKALKVWSSCHHNLNI